MPKFAATTNVAVSKTVGEIERLLVKYKATHFEYAWRDTEAMVGFTLQDRRIRLVIGMPDPKDRRFLRDGRGVLRTSTALAAAVDQAKRQSWRVLLLAIKAKLEIVESKIRTFEQEFGLDVVLPSGMTVGETILPRLDEALQRGFLLTAGEEQR